MKQQSKPKSLTKTDEIKEKVIDKIIEYAKELVKSENNPYSNNVKGFVWEHSIEEIINYLERLKGLK
jgi:uncharacterized protein YlzI (FlbEa/FlbD family)